MAEDIISIKTLVLAVVSGFIPALLWLWFWLKEDGKKPEPRGLIILSFIAGMIALFMVIPLEQLANEIIPDGNLLIASWAILEELLKFIAIYIIAFKSRFYDEPIDATIYLITVALGFAAMENFLYILGIISEDGTLIGLLNGNLRFIGATLLHVVSSASIGIALAFSFYKKKSQRKFYLIGGLITASLLHTIFNLSIIKTENLGDILTVFSYFWLVIVIIILLFERIKNIKPPLVN